MIKPLLILTVLISLLLSGCKGEKGDPGPQGATGQQGAAGQTGATGSAGQNAAQPVVYDFSIDLSKSLPYWSFPKLLDPYDVVVAYIMTNKGQGYNAMPFRGYAYATDQVGFYKMDVGYSVYSSVMFIENATALPTGTMFNIRAVILKGAKGGRLNMERYADYENLKKDFNLPD